MAIPSANNLALDESFDMRLLKASAKLSGTDSSFMSAGITQIPSE
jgi:hypothetical protein